MTDDALRALSDAATPGEWGVYFTVHGDPSVVTDTTRPSFTTVATVATGPDDYGRANAQFIAACVNYVRSLLDQPEPGRCGDLTKYPRGWLRCTEPVDHDQHRIDFNNPGDPIDIDRLRAPIHNPWSGTCSRHLSGDPTMPGATCPVCEPHTHARVPPEGTT